MPSSPVSALDSYVADLRVVAASGGVRDSVSAPFRLLRMLDPEALQALPGTRGATGGVGAPSSSSAGD